jgi:hypothetical protein
MISFTGKQDAILGLFVTNLGLVNPYPLTDHEGILFTKQEMTLVDLVVMDEGNSRRQLNFCKRIMYKNSLVVFKDCQPISRVP